MPMLVSFADLKRCLEKVARQSGQGGESSGQGAHRLNPDTGMSSHFFRQLSYGITDQIHLEKIKKGHVVKLVTTVSSQREHLREGERGF
jgi:hypothetical protein